LASSKTVQPRAAKDSSGYLEREAELERLITDRSIMHWEDGCEVCALKIQAIGYQLAFSFNSILKG